MSPQPKEGGGNIGLCGSSQRPRSFFFGRYLQNFGQTCIDALLGGGGGGRDD